LSIAMFGCAIALHVHWMCIKPMDKSQKWSPVAEKKMLGYL
jgi:hypothetical protein